MRRLICYPFLLALTLLFAVGQTGRADAFNDLYNSLGSTPAGTDPIAGNWGPLADSFTTGIWGVDPFYVTVRLQGTPTICCVEAWLLGDISDSPGPVLGLIGVIDTPGIPMGAFSDYVLPDFTADYWNPLLPNTRYWVELTAPTAGASWAWTASAGGVGVAGQSFANQEGTGSFLVFPDTNGPYQMEVTGVPEPPGISLLFAVVLLVAARTILRPKGAQ